MGTIIQINHFTLQEETTTITSLSVEIYKILGHGFEDTVYKDALEYEFKINGLQYIREKEFTIPYKQTLLSYQFIADFIVFDAVILEIRTKESITTEDYLQTLNHLKCTGCPVGLILNFGKMKLEIKRVAL